MARDPAATARAAFAMAARAELAEGQRAAALNRGMAIVEKYGLNANDFDIPGRPRATRPISGKRPTAVIFDEFGADAFMARVLREEAERAFRAINAQLAEARRRQAAEDLFRRTQREQQMKVRFDLDQLGRDRIRIVRNDGA